MFDLSLDSQQLGILSIPAYNNTNLIDSQDALYALNSFNSSQSLLPTYSVIDTVFHSITSTINVLKGLSRNDQIDEIMGVAFGENYQKEFADTLLNNFANNDFSHAPDIKLISSKSFNGAYAKDNNIYLSQEFVVANLDNIGAVTGVLLEEFGHYIDSQINLQDATGDEGYIFSSLVLGQSLNSEELQSLKLEDDHDFLVIEGLSIGIEKNVTVYEHYQFTGAQRNLGAGSHSYVGNDWNDRISSISLRPGWLMRGYEHIDFTGQEVFWNSTQVYVGNDWNDKISSFRIYHSDVVLGKVVDFNGDGRSDFLRQEKSDWDNDSHNTANVFFSNGNGTFWKSNLPENFDIKGDKTNLIFGDFNGDGRSDFIRQERSDWDNDSHNTANIFFSNGNGTFWKYDLGDYFKGDLTNLIIGDFNADGRSDFIRQEKGEWASDSYNTANIFFSNGNGTFRQQNLPESYNLKGDFTNLYVGDFNGDGRSDILRQEKGAWDNDQYNTANIFFSNGNGTFRQQNLPEWYGLKGDFTNLYVGDFNGDGRSDILRQEKGTWDDDQYNTANIFFSNDNGTFRQQNLPESYDLKGDFTNLVIGDFNGDGRSDFIRQERGGWDTDEANTANVFLSNGNGTFRKQDLTDWQNMKGDKVNILVGDFNGDGRSDFIRQEKDSWDDDNYFTAHIFTSNGNGTFWRRKLTDWSDMKGDFANIFTGAPRQFITEITGDVANRGLDKDWWGNVRENQPRYYNDGVNFYRFDSDGKTYQGIESGKETIVFIHGWKNNSEQSNFVELMKVLSRQNPYKQILALDWRGPAQHDGDWGIPPNNTARAIAPVAQWATSTLKSLGIEAAQLSLVGFSLGAHVAAEIGYLYGKVASLTALDPASPAKDYDIDGNQIGSQRAKHFNEVANKSIALVVSDKDSGVAGDNPRAATADYSFLVEYTGYNSNDPIKTIEEYHGGVVTVFRKLVERKFLPSSFAMNSYADDASSGSLHEGFFTAQWRDSDWHPYRFNRKPGSDSISSWV